MMKKLTIICVASCLAHAACAITMASQPWTTNRIAEAEARVAAKIAAATNAIPAPDYSTGNAQLVATIEAPAPAPGDYATVSNRAMTAVQSHQSLWRPRSCRAATATARTARPSALTTVQAALR